jgi:hypothetical protein
MAEEIVPSENEVRTWLISTIQHSCHTEYFLERFNLEENDPQRPHDLIGEGNKFSWEVIKGFALQYRIPKPDFNIYILPSLNQHRKQYHHQKWNEPDPNDKTQKIPGASVEDMLVGAVDAVCSLLENRAYQGGNHNYESIIEIAKKNPAHKILWMLRVIPQMSRLCQPNLLEICSLNEFPNIGINTETYNRIITRTNETLQMLRNEHGYKLEK